MVLLLAACGTTLGPVAVGEEEGERSLAPRLRVGVVFEDALDPVVGAEVWFLDLGPRGESVFDLGTYRFFNPSPRDPWVSLRTGLDGTVLVPPFTTMALLWGRAEDGESWVHEVPSPDSLEATGDIGKRATYPTEYLLELARGRRFHVRCVDATGRPGRDLPLVLRRRSPRDRSEVWHLYDTLTDAGGVATFFVAEDVVATWSPEDVEVHVEGGAVEEPFPLPADEPWDRVLTWRLPPAPLAVHPIAPRRERGANPGLRGEDTVDVRARIVDAAGDPLASSGVRLWADTPHGDSGFGWTDASGNLLGGMDRVVGGQPIKVELEVDPRRNWCGAGPRCTVLAPEPRSGAIDLGTVVLREDRPDLHGRVVGEDGSPVGGAMVVLTFEADDGRLGHWSWQLSRRDGTFSLYTESVVLRLHSRKGTVVPRVPVLAKPDSRLGVIAWAPGYFPATVHPLAPGSDVLLRRAAMIELEALLDPGTSILGLGFILQGAGGSPLDPPDLPYDLDLVFPRPRVPFDALRPEVGIWPLGDVLGSRRMRWSLLRGDERVDAVVLVGDVEIARVRDVRIDLGDPRADPRLHPLDLRGLVRTMR
jgi:hypothetical protein